MGHTRLQVAMIHARQNYKLAPLARELERLTFYEQA